MAPVKVQRDRTTPNPNLAASRFSVDKTLCLVSRVPGPRILSWVILFSICCQIWATIPRWPYIKVIISRWYMFRAVFVCNVYHTNALKNSAHVVLACTLLCFVLPWYRSVLPEHFMGNSLIMMTSSNGDIFRITGLLCGEFTGNRWIPRTKASDAELWCFLWSAPEWTVE